MSGFTQAYENYILNHFLGGTAFAQPTAWYVSLYNGDPEVAGVELSGTGYARQNNTGWTTASTGVAKNSATVDYGTAGGDWGQTTHFALHTAVTAGDMMASGEVSATANITNGEDVRFAPNALLLDLE